MGKRMIEGDGYGSEFHRSRHHGVPAERIEGGFSDEMIAVGANGISAEAGQPIESDEVKGYLAYMASGGATGEIGGREAAA